MEVLGGNVLVKELRMFWFLLFLFLLVINMIVKEINNSLKEVSILRRVQVGLGIQINLRCSLIWAFQAKSLHRGRKSHTAGGAAVGHFVSLL
jgi:hypothetical protein